MVNNSNSEVVFNNTTPSMIKIPDAMGIPSENQASGTGLEILSEIAGRVCYDSFGKGRGSKEFHKHILEVGHLSVYEHCAFTAEFDSFPDEWHKWLLNRPGLYCLKLDNRVRLTVNLRTILEWNEVVPTPTRGSIALGEELKFHASKLAPQVVSSPKIKNVYSRIVPPVDINEVWISVWLKGSRGFSHELVRHGDWTAISQRSTRYVDESESEMCWHPSIKKQIVKNPGGSSDFFTNMVKEGTTEAYQMIFDELLNLGLDLKTARGAARGVLPNALETQLIFSASLRQWNHIFSLRCSPFADGEIREIIMNVKRKIFNERIDTND